MKAFLKTTKGKIIVGGAALLIILLIVLLITKVIGGEEGYRNISVSEISGSVMTENGGKKYEAYKNMRLADGYALTTDTASYTRMVLDSDKYVKLEEKSRALFEALGSDKLRKTAIRLEEGILTTEITAPLGDEEDYIVNTPNAVLAVRGTFFKAVVRYDTNGDAYTDVYTYGGAVVCKRVMPDGTIVDEEVMINSGYKARIKMDEVITIYIEELIEEDEDNVDPIDINEVPDGDIVDVYNAAVHGHEMFAEIPVLWQEILKRDIDLNDYHSVYDGGEIPAYGEDGGVTETTEPTEAVTETPSETETNAPEITGGETDIPEEDNYNYNGAEGYYPAETSAVPNAETSLAYTERDSGTGVPTESVTMVRPESYIYTEPTEHTYSPYTEIFEDEPAVTEVTSVTTAETTFTETAGTETEPSVYTSVSNTTASTEERPASSVTSVTTVSETTLISTETTVPNVTSITEITTAPEITESTSQTSNTSQTSGTTATVPTEPDVHVHNFAEYIPDDNATCTEDGTKTAVCSCGERDTVIDTGSAGHKEAREVTEATFISEGNIRIYCSVCGETLANEVLPRAPLYIDDGSLVISETGYSQGGGEEIPYTGDYNIAQRSGTPAASSITVVSGTHNITFNGIDTSTASDTFTVERGAAAAIYGGSKENKFSAAGDNCYGLYNNNGSVTIKNGIFDFSGSCGIFGAADSVLSVNSGYIFANGSSDGIRSSGAVYVSGGTISAYGGSNGIWCSGELTVSGGNLSAAGGVLGNDIKTYKNAEITGGSVRVVNGKIEGKFVNGIGDELECEVFDVFPSEAMRTFENSAGDKYIYGLIAEDKASDGYYYVWKPVGFTPKFDGIVYMDNGSVVITADGITQGGKTFPWTEDIVISQKGRSTAFDVGIVIESGTHNITFDGVNINSTNGNGVDISSGANITVSGSIKENIIASAQERAINNNGTLRINGGAFKISGGYCGIYNSSQTAVNGGRISVSGGVCDIFNEESGALTVSGGSMKSENSAVGGKITNASGDELECKVYGEYTGDLTFEDSAGNEYAYKLDVGDSIDGGYYVWQPKGAVSEGVEVSEENFPDPVFREYVLENFDTDSDGYLSEEEIAEVTNVDVCGDDKADGGVTSLKGIEHFTALKTLYCYVNSGLTELDVSNNTALTRLYCDDTSITNLDISKNTALKSLDCSFTQITSLDVSKNSALSILNCYEIQITSLDVSNNTALKELNCYCTNIPYINITNNTAIGALNATNCKHPITVVNGKFDTKTIDGFDHTRASNCAVKDKNDNIIVQEAMDSNGVISGIKEDTKITYTYDCGQGKSVTFTLVPDDKSTFEPEETPFDGTLDLSAGPVTITSEGFVQNGVTTPWTGDYTVSGGSSSAITVESGRHNIILENADISADGYGLTIAEGAEVTISGSGTFSGISVSGALNAEGCDIVSEGQYGLYISGSGTVSIASGSFDLYGENIGIFCGGKLEISGGSVSAEGGQYGVMNSSGGVVSVSGGTTSISGGTDDIYSSGRLAVTGGSVRAENGTVIGSIVNADGAELECAVFDAFPSEAERTFTSPDGSEYVYKLTEGDRAADGKYYVWKPKDVPTGVEVSEENFPDPVFREYVSTNFDKDSDGWLSKAEIAGATYVNVGGTSSADGGVTSLQGIEYFNKLHTLRCYNNSGLTSLDLSNNTALTQLYCYDTQITNLDINSCIDLRILQCSNTQITNLDVSNNRALTELVCSFTLLTNLDLSNNTALTTLACRNTQIISLDISNNTALTNLECYNTQITSLDVSNNIELTYLSCGYSPIICLDISNNTKLKGLSCQNTKISHVDISNNPNITDFTAGNYSRYDNNAHPITVTNGKFDTKTIAGFDHTRASNCAVKDKNDNIIIQEAMDDNGVISGITEGTKITYTYDCGQGKSATFTLAPDENSTFDTEIPEGVAVNEENFPDTVFRNYISTNFDKDSDGYLSDSEIESVTEIDVSGTSSSDGGVTSLQGIEYLTALKNLYCGFNANLAEIDISQNLKLSSLDCSYTSVSSLDVRRNYFYNLNCQSCENLTELKIDNCYYVICDNTKINNLDVSNNAALTWLYCDDTQITSLNVSNNTNLKQLHCSNTKITDLNVSNNINLKDLFCTHTLITNLDISNNKYLEYLYCDNTQITSLDVSNNTALIGLWCYNTPITSLDVSNNMALIDLRCDITRITSLDVSNNTALKYLHCNNTQITSLDVSNNTVLTELLCGNTGITSLDVSKNTVLKYLDCSNTKIPYVDISNTSVTSLRASGCKYPIPSGYSFDVVSDDNFGGFDYQSVSNVQGADYSIGIFYNFTSDTITYDYDCGRGFTETFTLVMTDGLLYSDFAEDDDTFEYDFPEQDIFDENITTDIPEQVGEDDVPPENTEQDNGGEIITDVPEFIPDILLDAVIITAAAVSANIVDITIFAADIVIYLISILMKLWR